MLRPITSDPLTNRAGRYINTESPRPIELTVSSSGYRVLMDWSDWVGMNKEQLNEFSLSEWVEPTVRIVCLISKAFSVYPMLRLEGMSEFCCRVSNS